MTHWVANDLLLSTYYFRETLNPYFLIKFCNHLIQMCKIAVCLLEHYLLRNHLSYTDKVGMVKAYRYTKAIGYIGIGNIGAVGAGAHTIIILGASNPKVRTLLIYSSPLFYDLALSNVYHRNSLH